MKKVVGYTLIGVIIAFILCIIAFIVYFNVVTNDIELDLMKLERSKTSILLDRDDKTIYEDDYVPYDKIPRRLVDAFISVEDKKFFTHHGIDVKRMISALFHNILHRNKSQGASTITQQLIKNTHLSSQKTIDRKLKEIKLAILLERELSKEQIMEKYLNSLYFGSGIYGINNASKYIFGKELTNLSISDIATLAGIIKAPLYYSPINDISKSKSRRDIVLKLMYENGYISANEYLTAKSEDIIINNDIFHSNFAKIYTKQVYFEASSLLGMSIEEIINGDYKIATFYDRDIQKNIYDIAKYNDELIDNHDFYVLISDNANNGIKAFYSNLSMDISSFRRQVGSIMKPIAVYLPALEYGLIAPATIYNDEQITINGYTPHNYNDRYLGRISIRDAVKYSSNAIAVKLLDELSINKSKSFLQNMDITLQDDGLSIALGGLKNGLNPIEILSAYQTIANSGMYAKSSFIRYIADSSGNIVYRKPTDKRKICEDSSAYLMTNMLVETSKSGTARKLRDLPYEVASKTGTIADITNKKFNKDAYNMSFTSSDSMLVWYGNNLPSQIQGGSSPTILAREIYSKMYENKEISPFIVPNSVKKVSFDRDSYLNNGIILLSDRGDVIEDYFDTRYLPKDNLITKDNIIISYYNSHLSLKNIDNCKVKVYTNDIFHRRRLIKEIFRSRNEENIEINKVLVQDIEVEIYFDNELIYYKKL